MTTWTMVLLILGCAVVTWVPRIVPFALVRNVKMPKIILRWLAYIPVCILSALVIESVLDAERTVVGIDWLHMLALVPTVLVAVWTKSLSKTVVVGVMTMAMLRFLFT